MSREIMPKEITHPISTDMKAMIKGENYANNETLCSNSIKDCNKIKNRSECNNYYNINTKLPCRKGITYGCREYNKPFSANEPLFLACKFKINTKNLSSRSKRDLPSLSNNHSDISNKTGTLHPGTPTRLGGYTKKHKKRIRKKRKYKTNKNNHTKKHKS